MWLGAEGTGAAVFREFLLFSGLPGPRRPPGPGLRLMSVGKASPTRGSEPKGLPRTQRPKNDITSSVRKLHGSASMRREGRQQALVLGMVQGACRRTPVDYSRET